MKIVTKVVGMIAGERQHIVAGVSIHDPVLLVPEPDNPHDRNAVAVYTAPASALLHRDALVSSISDPVGGGTVDDEDRALLIDRQAGYVPRELAARMMLPRSGVVGYVSDIRHKPPEDRFDSAGRAHQTDDPPTVVGFDVAVDVAVRR